jgi:hypothetical protein
MMPHERGKGREPLPFPFGIPTEGEGRRPDRGLLAPFYSGANIIIRSLSDLDLLSIRIAMKYRTSAGFEAGCRREGVLHELEVNDLAIMNTGKD